MSTQPPDKPQYQPTELANPQTDPPVYQPTEVDPYVNPYVNPYTDYLSYSAMPFPPPPPPPLPEKRRTLWRIMSALLFAVLLVSGTVFVMRTITPGTSQTNTPQKNQITSTVVPTATPTRTTPTAILIPASSLTASVLYEDFVKAYLPVTTPVTISNNWWLSIGESYYPAKGGVQFTDTRGAGALEIAVFNGAAAATTDAQQATSYPTGWAAQYIQINTCVLFSAEGPVDISYYKPTMQLLCI